ncbi:hypothetical protein OG612_44875 (plasmid) [Streptomyces sp. NBC_01527]|uniref:hypothetical protein n=1 Tax=Streptomyces sp. NBC_01527 TaxID=2903894 RepID=UPI002F90EEA4
MSDRHATTKDLPDWNFADTVLELSQRPGLLGWIWLQNPTNPKEQLSALGRDLEGRLYADSASRFAERVGQSAANQGYLALLVGVEDGIALWVPRKGYHHIKPIDPNEAGDQPDVRRWLPIREVLKEVPAEEWRSLLG